MDSNLFEFILDVVIPVCFGIITIFIIPYIKKLIDSKTLELWQTWATIAVKAAEMIWKESGMGTKKKDWVVKLLTQLFNRKKTVISEEQMEALVEATVNEFNKNKNEKD